MSASDSNLSSDFGSVERGLAGDYEFVIGDVLREAWARTDGSKAPFAIAFLMYLVVYIGASFVVGLVTAIFDRVGFEVFDVLDQLIPVVIGMPMAVGMAMFGVRRSANVESSPMIVLSYFHLWLPIFALTLLMYIVVAIGLVLLVLPGLYLAVSYMLALPLLIDKQLEPWAALETSRKALTNQWLNFFGISLVLGLINFATIFTLGIGLIWTLPMTYIALGILYRKVFGIEAETLAPA